MTEKISRVDLIKVTGPARCSILVATYNRHAYLELLLWGLSIQTEKNFEVLICDDGSTSDTFDMLTRLKGQLTFPLTYLRQEDMGFRKARILNEGIAASRSDYLLFLDDDCVPHSRYVHAHLSKKRENSVIIGKYVQVRSPLTARINRALVLNKGLESPPFLTMTKKIGLMERRVRFYRQLLQHKPLRPRLFGANFATSKASLIKVNGFNEAFVGWGYEDNELRIRLVNSGASLREAISDALVFHLCQETPRNEQYLTGKSNKSLFLQLRNSSWAEHGLSGHGHGAGSASTASTGVVGEVPDVTSTICT